MGSLKLSHEEILKRKPRREDLKRRARLPIYSLLENVRSLYNVGAVFRTSDAILLKKLFLGGYTGCPPKSEISKTAFGAEKTVPWEKIDDPLRLIRHRKKEGLQIAALELPKGSVDYSKTKYIFPCCLIVGNEIEGISQEILKELLKNAISGVNFVATFSFYSRIRHVQWLLVSLDFIVFQQVLSEAAMVIDIPMLGLANSLNVPTACGIAIYEMMRQCTHAENPCR